MKFKRIAAAVTSLVCCAGMASLIPYTTKKVYAAEQVHNDFEVNYDGWYGNAENVGLSAVSGSGFAGTRGMQVSGRVFSDDGASSSKGFYLIGGVDYTYSVQVKSESAENFTLELLCIDMKTEEKTVVTLDTAHAEAGEWTELSAEYTAPENSYEFRLTITTDSTNDFYFDEVLVTSEEKIAVDTVYASSEEQGLKDAFANYFRVGNILNSTTVQNSAITASVLKDYNSIECENEMKPDATMVQSQCSGTNIGVTINNAAAIMDFCVQNGIGMRGHVLVWHSQTPSWFFKENYDANGAWVSIDVMNARMESYIKNLFALIEEQYPELDLYAYDVVNEVVSDDANRTANYGGAREAGDANVTSGTSAWVSVYGDNSFVEKAFTYARQYAPSDCKLFYNDYNEYWDHKRDCIYEMCKSLYEKGLLDGIGMQSHINANYDGFSGVSAYTTALQKYASIGCEVQITELDISIEAGTYTLQQQAEKYEAIFQAAMDINDGSYAGEVTAVCMWGPNDANTWIKTENAPLLYDTNNEPKAAYTTLMAMIPESEWGDGSSYGTIDPNEYGWYFHSTFEGDTDSWQGRGNATILTSGRTAYVGSEALLVQERTAAWNGVYRTLNPKAFVPGNEYSFSVNAMYFDGDTTEPFYLKLQYTDTNGETQYSTVAQATAVKGEWVQLANTNYQIPSDASNMQLYVETADSTANFYIDEAIGAVAGTYIAGAGAKNIILGDVNFDDVINAFDLALVKRYYVNGFDSTAAQVAADVDQSGKFDVTDIQLLQDYLLVRITEFPVAEKVIDTAAMEQLFSTVTIAESYKNEGENNPLFTQRFGADPGVMEYNGRVYVYTTNDVIEYDSSGNVVENTYAQVNKINCISSDDMVNWTDHGAIEVAGSSGAATWATNSWAPCATHKTINGQEKFFLYFCNGGNGVSVLTADSPTGPWSDPLGHGLITRSTPNCSNVTWLFDPAVFVDDDGTGYLYFGGGVPDGMQANPGTARVVKLGDDMISLAGDPQALDVPYLFEDSGINKIGDKYYYTYCSNWNTSGNSYGMTSGAIQYMVSDSPMGPFTYGGELFKNQGNFFGLYGNNHHSIVELNGQLYLFYHARAVEAAMGITGNYRSPQVDVITMNGTSFNSVTGTMAGIAQLKTLSPYEKVQAETMSDQAGINVSGVGDTVVSEIDSGDWIKVSGVNFANGCTELTLRTASSGGGAIKICTGSPTGTAIGYAEVSGSLSEITVPVNSVSGTQDLYFVFSGSLELDWWQFS
ncbi:MAG: endo-1,4-beta-xylanase [Oscillospiraceae bacterium]|nr:endo-1,4-beta-xylanase [Oscillospiraceae bacterium]